VVIKIVLKKMKKIFLTISIILFSTSIYSHSGGTDSRGGHNDRKNGGYHFHHGMGPHQHTNGICAYEENTEDSNALWYIAGVGVIGFGLFIYYNS